MIQRAAFELEGGQSLLQLGRGSVVVVAEWPAEACRTHGAWHGLSVADFSLAERALG